MKKGFITLMVALFTLVGMVSYGAVPEMWGIPDVIVGDLEDQTGGALTDNYFVFPDALDLDNYMAIASSGTLAGLEWIYYDAQPALDVIAINGFTADDTTDVYAVSNLASFRNVACTPVGGPYTAHPLVPSSTPIIVYLKVQNTVGSFSYSDSGNFTVFTIDETSDSLTNEFYRIDRVAVSMTADPVWTFVQPPYFDHTQAPPFGLRPCDGGYDATTGTYWLETTDFDNDFGFWTMSNPATSPALQTLIPYVDGHAYILTAGVWAQPVVPTGAEAFTNDLVPWIRLRVNSANETISQQLDVLSTAGGSIVPTTNPATATTETMVFDPRDQTVGYGTDKLYFSYDLIDFSAHDRTYPGENDEEGMVGITSLEVDSFPVKMLTSQLAASTDVISLPTTTTWVDDYDDFDHVKFAFGGNQPDVGLSEDGNLLLRSQFVDRGVCWHELLPTSTLAVQQDDTRWFRYVLRSKVSSYDIPWLRFRVFTGDSQRGIDYDVRPTGNWNTYQFVPAAGQATSAYNVFYVPKPGHNPSLLFSIDYIDFDPAHGDADIELVSVKVTKFTPPTPPPSP
jgi:hypothetical protein